MKISRAMLVGMLLAGSAQAGSWSDLWYRPDQQGEHALQTGDSKRAAQLFADPRRQAYAQLQSEQYAAAAKRLAPFADAGSQYNRGNALAKSGDLQGALDAYDAALKHPDLESALRRDAEHNRDLVARQLQAQKDQRQSSSGRQPPSKDKSKDESKDESKGESKDNENGKSAGNESKDGSGNSQSSNSPATAGSANTPQGGNHPSGSQQGGSPPTTPSAPSSQAKSQDQAQAKDQAQAQSQGQAQTQPQAKPGDEPRQTNGAPQSARDHNASTPALQQQSTGQQSALGQPAAGQQSPGQQANAGRQQPPPGPGARNGADGMNSRQASLGDFVRPQTEQQLALEQWLRQIPDDPGGLLRRKFMIEHLMQQKQEQEQP
jgi:Ca-activated chloride channel family protein